MGRKRGRFHTIVWLLICIAIGLQAETNKKIIRFKNPDKELVKKFQTEERDIASYKPGEYIDLVVNSIEEKALKADKNDFFTFQTENELKDNVTTSKSKNQYRDYETMLIELQQLAEDNPEICKLYDIGDSWGKIYAENGESNYDNYNHEIWAIKLSDNVTEEEDEPSVFFFGEHHARELISLEVTMAVLHELIDNYGTDANATERIDNTQIWFVPLVNPNGHKVAHSGLDNMWRKNIRDNNENHIFNTSNNSGYGDDGVDPNRNYGFAWGPVGCSATPDGPTYNGPEEFSEPETQAIKQLMDDHNFVAGITYHSYSELVLFPYGYSENSKAPDHQALKSLAEEMAATIPASGGGNYLPQQSQELYPAMGVTDDYAYGEKGIFCYTIELGTVFAPPTSQINSICDDNIEAAMILLDRVTKSTLTGHVTTNAAKTPLAVEIFVEGVDDTGNFRMPYMSNETFGRYFRLLKPGQYTVTFKAYGFEPQTITNVTIDADNATTLDIEMIEASETFSISGKITDGITNTPVKNAVVQITNMNLPPTTTDIDGNYTISGLYSYNYNLNIHAPGYAVSSVETEIQQANRELDADLFQIGDGNFEDSSISEGWNNEGNWTITSSEAFEGNNSIKSANISDNQKSEISISLYYDSNDEISFYKKVSSEETYDFLNFYIDDKQKGSWSGEVDWTKETYPILEGLHTFKWEYIKDGYQNSGNDCAWIDFVKLPQVQLNIAPENTLAVDVELLNNYPNPFNPSTVINYRLASTNLIDLIVFNARGKKVWAAGTKKQDAGKYSISFNGSKLNSGIYFYSLSVNGKITQTKKMIMIK